jgi:hypothetical protein
MTSAFCDGLHQHDLGHLSDRLGPLPVVLTGSVVPAAASGWPALRHRWSYFSLSSLMVSRHGSDLRR